MVAAVVLAAGASTRFGSAKQRLLLRPVLERVRAAATVERVVVVLGAHDVDTDAPVVRCADWERGPGASLRCGLAALPAGTDAAVVVLADGPDLAAGAVDRVVAAWRDGGGEVVAASYAGERGHPVLLARTAWARVPDEGARALEPRLVACDDLGPPGDVDRLIDLAGAPGAEWAAEVVVDEQLARELISDQFPAVELRALRALGEGWDNTVWLADERWVFRFPRRAIAVPAIERQLAVLPALAPLLPLPIPTPLFAGRPSETYGWPFLGCEYLPGSEAADKAPGDDARLGAAGPLARFLRALHDPGLVERVPAAEALPIDPMGRADMQARVPRTRARLAELHALGLWSATADAARILDEAAGLGPTRVARVAHGDLHARHLLLEENGLPAAVIDWDDLCLGDPAIDLSLVWSFLPPAGREQFLASYGPVADEALLRARVLALFLSGTLAVYGHTEGRAALEREALGGLERALS